MKRSLIATSLSNITITDALFASYIDKVAQKLLPYQWEVLNDRIPGVESSYCIENFKIAAGLAQGHHRGAVFFECPSPELPSQ